MHRDNGTFQASIHGRSCASARPRITASLQADAEKEHTMHKWVYRFDEVDQAEAALDNDWDQVRGLLGGKGANLGDMSRIGVPVPPGFTITTEACNAYLANEEQFPDGLTDQLDAALADTEKNLQRGLCGNTRVTLRMTPAPQSKSCFPARCVGNEPGWSREPRPYVLWRRRRHVRPWV